MNQNLISMYAPDGIVPLERRPIISQSEISSSEIMNILGKFLGIWTYEVCSETVIGDNLITNVIMYCKYGAFSGRSVTKTEYETNNLNALVNASERLISIEKPNANADFISQQEINSVLTALSNTEEPAHEEVASNDSETEVNIEPEENEPIFSFNNFFDNPPEPHDGLNNDEREFMQREEIPFDEMTPVMQEKMDSEVGMDNIPETFNDEYKADIKKFMDDNQIPARENMNAHLERFESGLNHQTLTPRKWIEFKKWWEQDRDTPIC